MNIDSILTLIGLVIAVYMVIPSARRLDIQILIRKREIIYILAGFLYIT